MPRESPKSAKAAKKPRKTAIAVRVTRATVQNTKVDDLGLSCILSIFNSSPLAVLSLLSTFFVI